MTDSRTDRERQARRTRQEGSSRQTSRADARRADARRADARPRTRQASASRHTRSQNAQQAHARSGQQRSRQASSQRRAQSAQQRNTAQQQRRKRPAQQRTQQQRRTSQRTRTQASQQRRSPLYLRILPIILIAVLLGAIIFGISRCVGSQNDTSGATGRSGLSQNVSDTSSNAGQTRALLSSTSMKRIPDDDGVFAFSVGPDSTAPAVSDAHRSAIEDAYDALTNYGASASFLFIDLQTGKGVGCNIDEPIYGASAIKSFYACYLAEGQVDAGRTSWSETYSEDIAYEYMDENGEYINDDVHEHTLESLVEDSVVRSENDAYRILRKYFDGDEYVDWLNSAGVDGDDWRFTDWWTNYTAREAAALWLHAREYVNGKAASASKLRTWLGTTDVSMIRNALDGAHERGYTLLNKAGWNADMEELQFNALGDAGIVSQDGKDYLVVVLSSYPGEDDTFYLAEDLIAALWNARADLAA